MHCETAIRRSARARQFGEAALGAPVRGGMQLRHRPAVMSWMVAVRRARRGGRRTRTRRERCRRRASASRAPAAACSSTAPARPGPSTCAGGPATERVVVERPEIAQARKRADRIAAGLPAQVRDPVIEVVLDAGAADQQRSGVNRDVHVLYSEFMASLVARHHHHHRHATHATGGVLIALTSKLERTPAASTRRAFLLCTRHESGFRQSRTA